VAFGRSDETATHPYVDIENEEIARDATARLASAGCRRIALHLLVLDDHVSKMRLQGHRRALEEAGLPFAPELVGNSGYTIAATEAWVADLLALPAPPDGLVCANELGLMGALAAVRRLGLTVGRDIRLVVRDSTGLSHHVPAEIGVHSVDLTLAGRLLVEALVAAVERPEKPPVTTLLGARFDLAGIADPSELFGGPRESAVTQTRAAPSWRSASDRTTKPNATPQLTARMS
jgi:LacI family transcriptional regulator